MKEIKDRLKEALSIRGMLPAELATKTGISKGNISRYLHGIVIPKQGKIGIMANALRVSPSWLMGYDVPMERETLPDGTFRGGESKPDVMIQFEKLSDKNREQALTYIKYLLDQQKGDNE